MAEYTIGSLCSGYGGLDMAVMDVLDASVAWHCQYDPADKHQCAARVLDARWPGVPNYGDITRIDWASVEPVDILTAGFPCQPVSNAGKRKGHEDERWLWPHVEAAIRGVQPRLVFLENVSALANRGGDRVLGSLAALGFDAEWTCLRASDVGAPHRRERWFCLAWPAPDTPDERHERFRPARFRRPGPAHGDFAAADTQGLGHGYAGPESVGGLRAAAVAGDPAPDSDNAGPRPKPHRSAPRPEGDDEHDLLDAPGRVLDWAHYAPAIARWEHMMGRPAPAPTEPGKNGPRLAPVFVEWMQGLDAGYVTDIDIPRNAKLKALGNGVVPQQGAAALRELLEGRRG